MVPPLALLAAHTVRAAETYTYPGLVAFMKDLERLSLVPDPEEKVRTYFVR